MTEGTGPCPAEGMAHSGKDPAGEKNPYFLQSEYVDLSAPMVYTVHRERSRTLSERSLQP